MTLTFTYYSPTTPYAAGWSTTLDNAVRKGRLGPVIVEAQLGSVGISSLDLDDPDATLGHGGDAIAGLKQIAITESTAPVGRRRIFTGYTGDRRYIRADSLIQGVSRRISCTLVDINTFLSFRVFVEAGANRPAETDLERIAWLIGDSILDDTLFDNGLVSTSGAVDMDAVDYRGQRPADLMNDCSQQSGKNHFIYYDETSGQFSLFYDFNDAMVYLSDLRVSNDLADVDRDVNGNMVGRTWAPSPFHADAELVLDPSRVSAGVYMPYTGGSVYRTSPGTAALFGWRDMVAPAANVKTATKANARADRFLVENSTEDEVLTLTLYLPAAHVNDWREGEAAEVKFTHLPGFEDFRWVRCVNRSVAQERETDAFYTVKYECSPLISQPSGGFGRSTITGAKAIPVLPHDTTPGYLLVALIQVQGRVSSTAVSQPDFYDGVGSPDATWTVMEWETAWNGAQNIGPPGAVAFGIAYRFVAVGEITTTPAGFFPSDDVHDILGVYLWEFPTTVAPTLSTSFNDTAVSPGATVSIGSSLSGWVLGGMVAGCVDYGRSPFLTPVTGTKLRSVQGNNDPTCHTGSSQPPSGACIGGAWDIPWTYIAELADGGTIQATISNLVSGGSSYNHVFMVGASVVIPENLHPIPDIPYPVNQSA